MRPGWGGNVTLDEFEARAHDLWASIPDALKQGVVGVVVDPEAQYDREFGETPLFGECMLDPALDGVPDAPVHSVIHLYYGSFVQIAAEEPHFDWDAELEETLRHELRHHLDWREGHDALGELDDLQRENMLRLRGDPFDRSFFRYCERLTPWVTALDDEELFIEIPLPRRELVRVFSHSLVLSWGGLTARAEPASRDQARQRYVYLTVATVEEPEHCDDATVRALLERDWAHLTLVARKRGFFERERPPFAITWAAPDSR